MTSATVAARLVLLTLLLGPPVAMASHVNSTEFQCDGGFCADGRAHELDCRGGYCKGDPEGFATISHPAFDGGQWLSDDDPVLGVSHGAEAKAYPLRILYWFETVDDRIDGRPILVSFCPLCWSGIVHERIVDGRELKFLNTGAIWQSDLVVYDVQTGSWWTQIGGEAITGPLHGSKLRMLDANQVSWQAWREAHPGSRVLARPVDDAGEFLAPYDRAPVRGADASGLGPDSLVHGVVVGENAMAFPVSVLEQRRGGLATVGAVDLVAAYSGGDVFAWTANGHRFRPGPEGTMVRDDGVSFAIFSGVGDDGTRLERASGSTMYLFAWHSFHPETAVYDSASDPPWSEPAPAHDVPALPAPLAAVLLIVVTAAARFRQHRAQRAGLKTVKK